MRRAFRRAGADAQPARGALVHGLRHIYATELANSNVSVYTLMKLLGESMVTSQRYAAGAARETARLLRKTRSTREFEIVYSLVMTATNLWRWTRRNAGMAIRAGR